MQCLIQNGNGFIIAEPQPTTYTECVHILVAPTELSNEAFNISALQGLQISIAIIVVWAVAFAFRAAIQSLDVDKQEY